MSLRARVLACFIYLFFCVYGFIDIVPLPAPYAASLSLASSASAPTRCVCRGRTRSTVHPTSAGPGRSGHLPSESSLSPPAHRRTKYPALAPGTTCQAVASFSATALPCCRARSRRGCGVPSSQFRRSPCRHPRPLSDFPRHSGGAGERCCRT